MEHVGPAPNPAPTPIPTALAPDAVPAAVLAHVRETVRVQHSGADAAERAVIEAAILIDLGYPPR